MNVILREDVDNLGAMGETVKVKPGYARNFLIPRNFAVAADSASAKQIEHELKIIKKRDERRRVELQQVAKQLEGLTVELKVRAGEGDKIFGSVTSGHIAEKLAEHGHTVDRKNVLLAEPIKSLGIFGVPVRLTSGIEAQIKVWVSNLVETPVAVESAPEEGEEDAD